MIPTIKLNKENKREHFTLSKTKYRRSIHVHCTVYKTYKTKYRRSIHVHCSVYMYIVKYTLHVKHEYNNETRVQFI